MNSRQRKLNKATKYGLKSGKFEGYSYRKMRIVFKRTSKFLSKKFGCKTRF